MELVNCFFETTKRVITKKHPIKIAFLFSVPSYWQGVKSFYTACLADSRFSVTVIFLDTKDTSICSSQRRMSEEFLYKNNINYYNYKDIDFCAIDFDIIVYQSPYNYVYDFFPELKIDIIKMKGVRPIYISYGIEYDKSVNREVLDGMHYHNYVQTLSWMVFVMHSDIRDGFFSTCRTGGAHVKALGHPRFDGYFSGIKKWEVQPGKDIKNKIVLVYQIHHPNNHESKDPGRTHSLPVKETVAILQYLSQREDTHTLVTFHPLFETWSIQRGYITTEELQNLKEAIRNSPNMSLFEEENYQPLLLVADAFLSEQSSLLFEMAFLKKPILYLYDAPLAMKPFAEVIARSFYHGNSLAHVEQFLDRLHAGDDPKQEDRERVHQEYFNRYDGRIGERIKQDILRQLDLEVPMSAEIGYGCDA